MVFCGNRTLRIVALLVGLAPLLLSCVKQADGTQAPLPDEKRQPISVSLRSSYRTKGTTPTEDEQRIVSLDVFVFRGNALEAHGRSGGVSVSDLLVTDGTKTIWAFTNYSTERMSAIRSLSDAEAFVPSFSENSRTAFCMKGSRNVSVSSSSTAFTVDVKRDVSKVQIASAPQFVSDASGATLLGCYLINIPKTYGDDKVLTSGSSSLAWNFDNTVLTAVDAEVSALTSASGTDSWQSALYGMPNSSPETASVDAKDYVTKYVFKASISGNTYWYPIGIPMMRGNAVYEVDNIVINALGLSAPNGYIDTRAPLYRDEKPFMSYTIEVTE